MCVVIVKSKEFTDIHVIKPIDYLKNHKNRLVTETAEKVNVHNQDFQSVFTTIGPLSFSRL